MYMSVQVLCSIYGGQKRVSNLLELELQVRESHFVGTGNRTQSPLSVRVVGALNHLAISPGPNYLF